MDGADLRVKVVGEGGNLGVTQLGRIEFARAGGRINTDAIDNSAGVDTSDDEVNIKIALQYRMERGDLDEPGRLALLTSMTDEVADLVLADNRGQNRVLGASRLHAAVDVVGAQPADRRHGRLRPAGPGAGIPAQPRPDQRPAGRREGLAGPSWPCCSPTSRPVCRRPCWPASCRTIPPTPPSCRSYFPRQMSDGSPVAQEAITTHPLAREIVTTETVNELVNRAGISYSFRLEEEMAATPEDAIRAYTITSEVFDLPPSGPRSRRWTTGCRRDPGPAYLRPGGCSTGPPAGC